MRNLKYLITSLLITFLAFSFPAKSQIHDKKKSRTISFYPKNPYYFQDKKGNPFIIIGDYTWETFSGVNSDYEKMFDSLKSRGINLARIWLWWGCEEFPSGIGFPFDSPLHIEPFLREGPGIANDGRPKYNLDKFNPVFFSRLEKFCKAADKRGINLQIIMMDAWMIKKENLWKLNAFHRDNNINKVDGDPNHTNKGIDSKQGFCSMGNPKAYEYQKSYIRKVVETVNRFDGIYFEIANENFYNEAWELTLGGYIKEIELKMPNQHLVIRYDFPSHHYVVQEWDPILVHKGVIEKRNLKVPLLFDTDWMINENDDEIRKAAWAAIASGGHFSYMEESIYYRTDTAFVDKRPEIHKQIDHMVKFMRKIKPWEMTPDDSLVRSGLSFTIANNKVLFAYLPYGGGIVLDLSAMKGLMKAKWYNPLTGEYGKGFRITGSSETRFTAADKNDWVLLVKSK